MKEIDHWIIMSESSPDMTPPLVHRLNYNRMIKYGNKILLGKAKQIPELDPYKKNLHKISSIFRNLHSKAQTIYLNKYIPEVKHVQVANSSGTSDVTTSMVKIEALDTEWAEIGWRRFNLPCCTDYPPRRYRKGLDLLIQKETDYLCSHRLQTILIFDIKANMHNKSLRGYKI